MLIYNTQHQKPERIWITENKTVIQEEKQ